MNHEHLSTATQQLGSPVEKDRLWRHLPPWDRYKWGRQGLERALRCCSSWYQRLHRERWWAPASAPHPAAATPPAWWSPSARETETTGYISKTASPWERQWLSGERDKRKLKWGGEEGRQTDSLDSLVTAGRLLNTCGPAGISTQQSHQKASTGRNITNPFNMSWLVLDTVSPMTCHPPWTDMRTLFHMHNQEQIKAGTKRLNEMQGKDNECWWPCWVWWSRWTSTPCSF